MSEGKGQGGLQASLKCEHRTPHGTGHRAREAQGPRDWELDDISCTKYGQYWDSTVVFVHEQWVSGTRGSQLHETINAII